MSKKHRTQDTSRHEDVSTSQNAPTSSTPTKKGAVFPVSVRIGALIAIIESIVCLAYALFLVLRDIAGMRDTSLEFFSDGNPARAETVGFGTAAVLIILFGAVLTGAIMVYRGRGWGRGPIVLLNILLIPVAYYISTAHHPVLAALTFLVALAVLACFFNRAAISWAAAKY